jgi:MoaA/NifB/PqqE/SkfB family radical SAM enzyme
MHRLQEARWGVYQKLESDLHELRYLFWRQPDVQHGCRHCGSDCGRDDSLPGLPADVVKNVFSEIAQAFSAPEIMLVASGGEPFVPRVFSTFWLMRGKLGMRLGMVTNGWALGPQTAARLAEIGMESIVVSLDGPREVHDWLRNREGSFERAVNALRHLRQAGIPIVEGITCVTHTQFGISRSHL